MQKEDLSIAELYLWRNKPTRAGGKLIEYLARYGQNGRTISLFINVYKQGERWVIGHRLFSDHYTSLGDHEYCLGNAIGSKEIPLCRDHRGKMYEFLMDEIFKDLQNNFEFRDNFSKHEISIFTTEIKMLEQEDSVYRGEQEINGAVL